MSRAGGLRALRPVTRGPLQFQTHEVRNLERLHHRSLNSGPDEIANPNNWRGKLLNAGIGYVELRDATQTLADAQSMRSGPVAPRNIPWRSSPKAANRDLEELAAQLLRYRDAIELVADPLARSRHNIDLGELLDQQEGRARRIAILDQAPPFTVIVRRSTALAAGVVIPAARIRCDRGMSWRVWEATAWNTAGLLANQEACSREEARQASKIGIEEFWHVWQPHDLRRLSRHLSRDARMAARR